LPSSRSREGSPPPLLLLGYCISVLWLVLFAIEQQVMSFLTQTLGWFVDHLPVNLRPVEKTGSSIQLFAQNMAEGVVLIVLGLLVGLWTARRKRQSLGQPE
jgi:hypothetical protein